MIEQDTIKLLRECDAGIKMGVSSIDDVLDYVDDGEFLRFGGSFGEDRMESAAYFARQWNSILVLKGHRTCVTDGVCCYRNTTGNPGMAVGGSGDVLAGMITAFLGQGITPLEAAACGVWLHGAAGDLCAEELGQYGMLPSDMLERLPRLMK